MFSAQLIVIVNCQYRKSNIYRIEEKKNPKVTFCRGKDKG